MLYKSLNYRLLSSIIVFIKRSIIVQSEFNLINQMKLLNNNEQFKKALELFDKYEEKNLDKLSNLSITQVLKACAGIGDLQRGQVIHHRISSRLKNDSYMLTSLIHLYMKCGDVAEAQSLFNISTTKTLPMYGAMMRGFITNNQAEKTIDLFKRIENPDEVIFILLFNACAQLKTKEALNLTKQISKQIPNSFRSNNRLLTSLLDALMKCGDVAEAQSLFNISTTKTLSMYGAMMKGFITNNQAEKTIDLFKKIQSPNEVALTLLFNACAQLKTKDGLNLTKQISEQIPNSFRSNNRLLTSLLDALIKCGDIEHAETFFNGLEKKKLHMYGIMINGYLKENQSSKILNLFNEMKINNVEIDHIIGTCLIKCLSNIGDYELSQSIYEKIPKSCFIDNQIQNTLIDMWGKSGSVNRAKEIFDKIVQPDQIGYTAMINTYGLNGMGIRALELYHKMPKELINEITYVCILNACSHSGLVNEAREIFKNIEIKTEIIYTTMIDCLRRSSFFEEAQELIDKYEHSHLPSPIMYLALLSGARNVKDSDLSQQIYHRMKRLCPQAKDPLIAASILLANVYASSGDIGKSSDIKVELSKLGAKKKIGLSSTVTNEQVYQFRAHDRSHPRSKEIYAEVEKISSEIISYGHQYDSSWITRPIDQDETIESVLCGHSERLAIAWNFVQNPNTSRIQVTKNLRVCGDCHRVTKLIALIRQCEIIVRDTNRIHHFYRNGQCSCNDYF